MCVRGPIRYQDILHFMTIGAQIAVGTIYGSDLKNQIESSADGSLNPDVTKWKGGWLFGYSGVSFDLDPYQAQGSRASNIRVGGVPLNPAARYTYASYWSANQPSLLNGLTADDVHVLTEPDGSPLDGSELVVRYLATLPGRQVPPFEPRVRLLAPLPPPVFANREVQPLRGARH
jgi:sulfur-oxidizing protein SoxB